MRSISELTDDYMPLIVITWTMTCGREGVRPAAAADVAAHTRGERAPRPCSSETPPHLPATTLSPARSQHTGQRLPGTSLIYSMTPHLCEDCAKTTTRRGGPRGHLRLSFHGNASQLPVICLAPSGAAWTLELMAFRAQLGHGRWNPSFVTSSLLRNGLTPRRPLEVALRAKRMRSSSTTRVCGFWGCGGPGGSPSWYLCPRQSVTP